MAINTGLPSITPINFRGTWNRSVTYFTNDVVKKDNANYIALGPNVGIEPPSPATWNPASTDTFGLVLGGATHLTNPIVFGGTILASSTQSLLEIGAGSFDGVSTGHFTGSASGTALGINLTSGSTADPLNIQVAGTTSFKISTASPLATLISPVATTIPLVIKGASGQSGDLLQLQSSTAAILAKIDSGGAIVPNNGARITSGSGVPTTPGGKNPTAGDLYIRTDLPTTANSRLYMCSIGGASPTWTALI